MRPQIIVTLLVSCCAAQIQRAQHRHLGVRLDGLHERIQKRNNTPYEPPAAAAAAANMGSSVPSTTGQPTPSKTSTAGTPVDTRTIETQSSDSAAVYDTVFVTSTRAGQQQSIRRDESSSTLLNLVGNVVSPTAVTLGSDQTSASSSVTNLPSSSGTASQLPDANKPHINVVSATASSSDVSATPTLIGAPMTTASTSDTVIPPPKTSNTAPRESGAVSAEIQAPSSTESSSTGATPSAFVSPFDLVLTTSPSITPQPAPTPVAASPAESTNSSGVSGLTSTATNYATPVPTLVDKPEVTNLSDLSGTISTTNTVTTQPEVTNSPGISGASSPTNVPASVPPAVLPADSNATPSSSSVASGHSSSTTALSGMTQGVVEGSPQASSVVTPSDSISTTGPTTTASGLATTPTNQTTFRGPVTSDTISSTPLSTALTHTASQDVETQESSTASTSSHTLVEPTLSTTVPVDLPTTVHSSKPAPTTNTGTSSPPPAPVQTMDLPPAVLTAPSTPATTAAAAQATAATTQTTSATNTPALPAAIAPAAGIIMPNSSETLVQIGFLEPLNYPFVVSNALSTAQILSYTPKCVAYALGLSQEAILANSLRPYDKSGYIATVAYIVIPSAHLIQLEAVWNNTNSVLYNQQDSSLQSLAVQIDSSIPLLVTGAKGDTISAGVGTTGGSATQANSASYGSLADTGPSSSSTGSTKRVVSIGIGSAAAAGMYASLMFFVARRYRSRRITLFAPSIQSARAGIRGTRGISRPMNPENSLGI